MQTFLQILGITFLLIIVGLVVGFALLRRRFKKFQEELDDLAGSAMPALLTLEPRTLIKWANAAEATKFADDLMLHGFQTDGLFEAAPVSQLYIQGFVCPARNLFAAVYEHPMGGLIVDVLEKTVDGRTLTITNVEQGGEMDSMPGKSCVRLKNAEVAALMSAWEQNRLDGEPLPAEPGSFKTVFETAYRDEMAWRAARGGPTAEEVRRVAEASGEFMDGDTEAMAVEIHRRQANSHLDEILRRKFLEEGGLTALEWDDAQNRLVVIHDNLLKDELEDYLSVAVDDWDEGDDFDSDEESELGFEIPNLPARDAFAAVNATFPPDRQFTHRWACTEPIAADFYLEPID